jgi:hypothetical protein
MSIQKKSSGGRGECQFIAWSMEQKAWGKKLTEPEGLALDSSVKRSIPLRKI